MNRPVARGNNVKRFKQAFSLEKRYIKIYYYLQSAIAFNNQQMHHFRIFLSSMGAAIAPSCNVTSIYLD
jgi:hypothetical protein